MSNQEEYLNSQNLSTRLRVPVLSNKRFKSMFSSVLFEESLSISCEVPYILYQLMQWEGIESREDGRTYTETIVLTSRVQY